MSTQKRRAGTRLVCPRCQLLTPTKVLQHYQGKDNAYIVRRRVCGCAERHRFTTYEFADPIATNLVTLEDLLRQLWKLQEEGKFHVKPTVRKVDLEADATEPYGRGKDRERGRKPD